MEEGFSGVVRLSNISDFIAPAAVGLSRSMLKLLCILQNCVISTEDNITKEDRLSNSSLNEKETRLRTDKISKVG